MKSIATAPVLEIPKKRAAYGGGSIVQRGFRWQISFYDREGRRRRESFTTLSKAEKRLNTLKVLRESGKLDPHERRTKIDVLADLYLADRKGTAPKSVDWLESVWEGHLEPFFGGYLAARITTEKIIEYRNERLEAGASPTTVNKELTILRAMFNHGFEAYTPPKVLHVPRFPERLKEPNPRQGFLADDQYDSLQANCKHRWLRALIAIAYTFGFRKSELVGRVQRNQPEMKVSQINLKDRTIHLWAGTTKNDEGRTVKMTEEVYSLLCECVRDKKPGDAVFTWANGKPVKDFRGAWLETTKAAGLPSLLFHDFRRSAARNLLRAGVSRDVAKRITGHRTDSMFSRYAIVTENDLADAASKLEICRNGRKIVTEAQSSESSAVKY